MHVQWCIKGIPNLIDVQAEEILDRRGLKCRWWHVVDPLPFGQVPDRLDELQLYLHQNAYLAPDPRFGGNVCDSTPFISLTAGCVQRNVALLTNVMHRAHLIAVDFATELGKVRGHLFYCWVVANGRAVVAARKCGRIASRFELQPALLGLPARRRDCSEGRRSRSSNLGLSKLCNSIGDAWMPCGVCGNRAEGWSSPMRCDVLHACPAERTTIGKGSHTNPTIGPASSQGARQPPRHPSESSQHGARVRGASHLQPPRHDAPGRVTTWFYGRGRRSRSPSGLPRLARSARQRP
jgi:hypothetical protein